MKSDVATFHRRKSGGHYARVMGTLHRHLKAEACGDAALGLLLRTWSYCADVGRAVLTERDMARLMVRDRNGPRKLKALVDAGLLDKVDGGYSPHDWFDHNPGLSRATSGVDDGENESPNATPTRVDGESNVTGNVTLNATKNVSKPVEQNQTLTPPLSRLRTQDPREEIEEEKKREGACAPDGAVAPAPQAVRAVRGPAPERAEATALRAAVVRLRGVFGHEVTPTASQAHWAKGTAKVVELVRGGAAVSEAAERVAQASLGWLSAGRSTSFGYALQDCVLGPVASAPRGGTAHANANGRPRMSPAATGRDFEGADVDAQLERMGAIL